jgi:hypothetical protein
MKLRARIEWLEQHAPSEPSDELPRGFLDRLLNGTATEQERRRGALWLLQHFAGLPDEQIMLFAATGVDLMPEDKRL